MQKKISVVVPVYNVEPYLHKCLRSVVNQTYHNLEIILVDDGSSDKSGAICDEYAAVDDRVAVIHRKNAGVGAARNIGLNAATGEWIAFIDSDDWIDMNYFEKIMENEACIDLTNADVIMTGGWFEEGNQTKIARNFLVPMQFCTDIEKNSLKARIHVKEKVGGGNTVIFCLCLGQVVSTFVH